MPAYEIPNLRFSGVADAAIARRRFLKVDASENIVQCAASTDKPVGVSSIDCQSGQVIEIYDGIVIVEAGAAVNAGQEVMSDANGQAIPFVADAAYTTTPAVVAGYAMTKAAAAGEFIAVKVY